MQPQSLQGFLREYLDKTCCTQVILSQDSGIPVATINKIYTGRQTTISNDVAIAFEKATRIKAEKWLTVAMIYNLHLARVNPQCN
jgi:plasmid maintenance system antidote protein VapI